jgi:signal transduction histidine kinase
MGDTLDASILYSRKSRIYFIKKDYKKSSKFALQGMSLDTLVGNRRALAISYFQVAQNEYAMNNLTNAERLLQHSIRINREIGNLTSLIRAHELLATVYLDTHKPSLAVSHLQLANQYKDSLYNSEKSGQIQEMQSLYELEGKENTIKLLEQDNAFQLQEVKNQELFLAFLLVGILLLMVIIFFLFRLRTVQNKTNKDLAAKNIAIELQKEEMQTQAEKLHQLNQLQTKLFSVISHDLRGPISNLQSLLELFTKKLMTAEEFLMISDKLKSNLNVTQRTLENLLNWSLSQMDGIKTEKKNIDINSCIEEASRLMEEVALRKNVMINKELKESLMVRADPDQVQLILRNLIHNGIKFSKIGDSIRISVNQQGRDCCVSIQDTGIGMSKEEMDRIAGSRQHFTKRGTQQEKGTGLGLLLCKEFIERNDGVMTIKSKPDEGTEVSFTLKLA